MNTHPAIAPEDSARLLRGMQQTVRVAVVTDRGVLRRYAGPCRQPACRGERAFVSSLVVRFLRRHDAGAARAWWDAVAEYPHGAPGIVRELLVTRSVACDPLEAEQALAWARAHPAWTDDPAPLTANDPNATTDAAAPRRCGE